MLLKLILLKLFEAAQPFRRPNKTSFASSAQKKAADTFMANSGGGDEAGGVRQGGAADGSGYGKQQLQAAIKAFNAGDLDKAKNHALEALTYLPQDQRHAAIDARHIVVYWAFQFGLNSLPHDGIELFMRFAEDVWQFLRDQNSSGQVQVANMYDDAIVYATMLGGTRKFSDAVQVLQDAFRLGVNDQDGFLHGKAAFLSIENNSYEDAKQLAEENNAKDHDMSACRAHALACVTLCETDLALDSFENLMHWEGGVAQATTSVLTGVASLYIECGKYQECTTLCTEAYNQRGILLEFLSYALLMDRNPHKACNTYEDFLKQNQNSFSQENYTRLYVGALYCAAAGRTNDALQKLQDIKNSNCSLSPIARSSYERLTNNDSLINAFGITCPVCKEQPSHAIVSATCGHVTCAKCAMRMKGLEFSCPYCRDNSFACVRLPQPLIES